MSLQKWIYDYDDRRFEKFEARANRTADKMVADIELDDEIKQLLREFYFCQVGLAQGGNRVDRQDLLERYESCTLEISEAFGDEPWELAGEVIDERSSTANALGRTALGSVEPDATYA